MTRSRACFAAPQHTGSTPKQAAKKAPPPAAGTVDAPSTPEPRLTRSKGLARVPQPASPAPKRKRPAEDPASHALLDLAEAAGPGSQLADLRAPTTPRSRECRPGHAKEAGQAPTRQTSADVPPRSLRTSTTRQRRLSEEQGSGRPQRQQGLLGQRKYALPCDAAMSWLHDPQCAG